MARMSNRIKVRFHLAAGEHFMHWQVKIGEQVTYYKPSEVFIEMRGCKLRNHRGVAERIHAGENKTVCAWIECEAIAVYNAVVGEFYNLDSGKPVRYNPRVAPYWMNGEGENLDNSTHRVIYSRGKGLLV
jgi:hypothetical protein